MKKFYYKKEIKPEETPILDRLERRSVLEQLAMEVNSDEWHQMAMRTLSGTSSVLSDVAISSPSPTTIIRDSDLASSWIYASKKASSTEHEGNSKNSAFICKDSELVETTVRPFVPTQRQPRSFSCWKYTCLALTVVICLFGILSSVLGIVYLEVFAPKRAETMVAGLIHPSTDIKLPTASTKRSLPTESNTEILNPVDIGNFDEGYEGSISLENEEDNWESMRDLLNLTGVIGDHPNDILTHGRSMFGYTIYGIPVPERDALNSTEEPKSLRSLLHYTTTPKIYIHETRKKKPSDTSYNSSDTENEISSLSDFVKPKSSNDTLSRRHGQLPSESELNKALRTPSAIVTFGEKQSTPFLTSQNSKVEDVEASKEGIPASDVSLPSPTASTISFGEFLKVFRKKLPTRSTPGSSDTSESADQNILNRGSQVIDNIDEEERKNYLNKLRNLMYQE